MPEPYYQDDMVTLTESDDQRRKRLSRESTARHRARTRGEGVPFKVQDRSRPKSAQHRERISAALKGSRHPRWQGDAVSERGGRARALRAFPEGVPCDACGAPESERHHIDANTANNTPSNIARLCRRCHMEADGRLDRAHPAHRRLASRLPPLRLARTQQRRARRCRPQRPDPPGVAPSQGAVMDRQCTGPECTRPRRKLTLCDAHYAQWRLNGELRPIRAAVRGLPHDCTRHQPGRTCYQVCRCRCDGCRAGNAKDRQLRKMGRLAYADPTGTRRRLQALTALGWTNAAIAAVTGICPRHLATLRNTHRPINRATAAKVAAGYDRLSMKLPPDTPATRRNRTDAAHRGWLPPLCWDDAEIDDPAAKPRATGRQEVRRGTADDVAWMAETGESLLGIQRRTGLSISGIEYALKRADRDDLWRRIMRRESA